MRVKKSRKGAPGIVEVAERAGVSIATVSRALSKPDVVREATRLKIEIAASELGYIPNSMASGLHQKFSGTVGLIVPTIDNAIFAEMINAFTDQLRKHDRNLLIATHNYDLSHETSIIRSLLERRIDGIVLVGLDHEQTPMNMLAGRNIPVVQIWNYKADSQLPCIGADNFGAGACIATHLIELGHTDIGFVFPDLASNDRARDRLNGAKYALQKSGIKPKENHFYTCPYNIGAAKELAKTAFLQDLPTAIICGNDVIAQGIMLGFQALGIKVPKDVSIAGIGDFSVAAYLEPSLTTARLPAKRIGRLAADQIVHMCDTGNVPDPKNQVVEFTFLKRESTAEPH
ncbi:MAG: LacI family DNA-binding transcriptional regulator [Alphaproteobacteria bacterium]